MREDGISGEETPMTQLSMIAATTDDFLFNSPNGYDTFVLKVTGLTDKGKSTTARFE
jgi:hypothetical protein